MESETIFRIILPALLVAFIAHRGYYTKKYKESASDTLKKREEGAAAKLAGVLGIIGFISMIVYVINPGWLSWVPIPLPFWLRWLGVGIALSGFILLQWAQNTLGKSWSDTPRMIKEQALVTGGPYKLIRHPIYTAFLLILGSTLFISSNWLIGLAFVAMTALEIASRIGFEEALMVEYFGDQYREYMQKTGQLFPKVM